MKSKTAIVILFILFSAACGVDEQLTEEGILTVLTTTGMIADTVRNIGGDKVAVSALMGPGVDPHLYKASAGDIHRISRSSAIFYNGLMLEGKMATLMEKIRRSGKAVFAVGDVIDSSVLLQNQEYAGHPDPHIWFDVAMWRQTVDPIAEALMDIDPENADVYHTNAESYKHELTELDDYCRVRINSIPSDQRVMITAHDAFGYFGRAYGIEVQGLQGINTSSEYGIRDVQRLVDLIVDNRIRAVFVESSVPRRSIEAVVEGCRARDHDVVIGGELYSDALGEAGTAEATYIGMVRHNVDTIVKALR
jgi:manganese/zinc/iron transport system substrate-binding protein